MKKYNFSHKLKGAFPFITKMETAKFNELIKFVSWDEYRKGTVVLEGHVCSNLVLILDGCIRVYKLSPDGKEVTLYRVGRGETCILMVSCLLGNTQYPAIAEVENHVELALIPSEYFKKLFSFNTHWQKFIFNTLSGRLTEVMMIVEEVAFKSMDKRLATYIILKTENAENPTLNITHEKIAMELGTAREVVSRILKDFEKKDFLILSRGKITIKNRNELQKYL